MFNTKRFIIATLMGFVTGFICLALASGGSSELADAIAYQIVFSRALIGFAIGISVFKMGHWLIHGGVIGIIFSLPLAFSGLMAPENPDFSKTMMFVMTIVLGMIYGILIELVTSVLFKAKMQVAVKTA